MQKPRQRIVVSLPLEELWTDVEVLSTERGDGLSSRAIIARLRAGPLRFVVANCGNPLRWISERDCFDFWKTEVKLHLAEPEADIDLENFPGGYCYCAIEWTLASGGRVVVLEMLH